MTNEELRMVLLLNGFTLVPKLENTYISPALEGRILVANRADKTSSVVIVDKHYKATARLNGVGLLKWLEENLNE